MDSLAQEVGILQDATHVYRKIGDSWFSLPIAPEGFVASKNAPTIYYLTSNCSGTPMWPVTQNSVVRVPFVFTVGTIATVTTAYYTAEPLQQLTAMSFKALTSMTCTKGMSSGMFGALTSFDLAALGLAPPFAVK